MLMHTSIICHGARARLPGRGCRAAFTLTELLVVMGIIAVLGGITALGFRAIAKDAKLASGKNAVMAVLDNARGLAMKNNRPTMVMFFPKLISPKECRIEAVIAEWSGSVIEQMVQIPAGTTDLRLFERYTVVKGTQPRVLPEGVSIGGPNYNTADSADKTWYVPSNLAHALEAPGQPIAILYAPDGTTRTENPATSTYANNYPFVDFNNDGLQNRLTTNQLIDSYFWLQVSTDEPCAHFVPFVAVFNEDQAREFFGDGDWNVQSTRDSDLSQYINSYADRIHFNRYTGVAMK